jgi:glycosyltransferase involved in cell wall biosynthesis
VAGKRSVRAVIGAPLYNHAKHLPEAIDSLLAQTYEDYAVVLVDDGSTDETAALAARYAERDERVTFVRNPTRLGMIGNWRRAFELARSQHPEAEFFAWGSDHDVWEPGWLEALVARLDAVPEAVLAYPQSVRIDDDGEIIRGSFQFDTSGVTDTRERIRITCAGVSAGNMVYGLYRADALERAGIFRAVVSPDRLVMLELALQGTFEQVPELLWKRRFAGLASAERQLRAFFPDGRAPWYAKRGIWQQHVGTVAWRYVALGEASPAISRREAVPLTLTLFRSSATRQAMRRKLQATRFIGRRKKALLRTRKRVLKRLAPRKRF